MWSHRVVRLGLLAGALTAAAGAELKKESLAAFERYAQRAEARIEREAGTGEGFIFATMPERRAALRTGAVIIEAQTRSDGLKVSNGLIHDWAGAVFIRDVSIARVLELVQSYNRHKELYRPEVIASRLIERDGNDFRVYMRLLKKKGLGLVAPVLDTEHEAHYERVTDTRWWSRSRSTRITEVEDAGSASERRLPPDTGHGYLWRLNSYWTFQELDGGTYVECEAISLTRDVPRAWNWLIGNVVRSLPKESLTNTLLKTRDAARGR